MPETYSRIDAIPMLAGEQLEMLTAKVEAMRARSREYIEEVIAQSLMMTTGSIRIAGRPSIRKPTWRLAAWGFARLCRAWGLVRLTL